MREIICQIIEGKKDDGIITNVVQHFNWRIAYGLRQAYTCDNCRAPIKVGDKTVEISVYDIRRIYQNAVRGSKEKNYYCAKCADV